jgi:pimeloyl-ACP methyl ester carboxylesterase
MNKQKPAIPNNIKWLQRFFSVAGHVAPNALLPVLIKSIFTPKKQTLKPPHIACLEKGEPFTLKVPAFRKPKQTIQLAAYRWGNGDKLVLLVHGWDAKGLDYYKMIPPLVQAGYTVVTFDGPGHGASEGDTSNLVDFKELLPIVINQIGQPYAIIAHSMGGGASAHMLIENDIHVERLVLLTVPIMTRYFLDESFKFMRIPVKMQRAFMKKMNEEFGEDIDKYNLITRKEPVKADKILLAYEEFDEEVPVSHVTDFLTHQPTIEPMFVSGVGHARVMKDPKVIERVMEFLQ